MNLYKNLRKKANDFLGKYRSKDPASFAAAQQAIGGLLILDGFIGIDNPFGEKKRPGIFGAISGVILGIIFIFMPTVFSHFTNFNKMTSTTTATVVSVGAPVIQTSTSTTNDQNTTNTSSSCSLTVKYTVSGKDYNQMSSDSSSNNCSKTVGSTLTINYDPNNPASWSNNVGTIKLALKVFFWVGIFAVIVSGFTFLIRLVSIIFGIKLLLSGRALASTLPNKSISAKIDSIKDEFKKFVFKA